MSWKLRRTMLAHHNGRGGVHGDAERAHTVYQSSTIGALLAGIYDGDVTIAELLEHGDFGLGTFNRLDGEMIVLDGVCYHLRADGSARVAAAQELTPFAVVTWFQPDATIELASATREELAALVDHTIPSENLLYALRIDGTFKTVSTRTVAEQSKPYPPLTEAAAGQALAEFREVSGTLAGFRTPDYEQGISVAGYHLHFIDQERAHGGHVLGFELEQGRIQISASSDLQLSLPRSGAFLDAKFSLEHMADEIESAEG